MINKANYFNQVKTINYQSLPEALKEGFDTIKFGTKDYSTWKYLEDDPEFLELYFNKLNAFLQVKETETKKTEKKKPAPSKPKPKSRYEGLEVTIRRASENSKMFIVWDIEKDQIFANEKFKTPEEAIRFISDNKMKYVAANAKDRKELALSILKAYYSLWGATGISNDVAKVKGTLESAVKTKHLLENDPYADILNKVYLSLHQYAKSNSGTLALEQKDLNKIMKILKVKEKKTDPKLVAEVDPVLKIFSRYAYLYGQQVTVSRVANLLSYLQKQIITDKISKSHEYYDEIKKIEKSLQKILATADKDRSTHFKIQNNNVQKAFYQQLSKGEKVRPSVNAIKRFTSMVGKEVYSEKVERLSKTIEKILESTPKDKYAEKLKEIQYTLSAYLSKHDHGVPSDISLAGVFQNNCPFEQQNIPESNRMNMISARDLEQMQFTPLGLDGEWLELLGDVTLPFSMMLFGLPGQGKSTLALKFAAYLTDSLDKKVLFVAAEEGFGATLKDKIKRTGAANRNLFISTSLPADLTSFDVVFIDSVNQLEMSPEEFEQVVKNNPKTCFVFVFRSTKQGKFRGEGTFENIVDISIQVDGGRTMTHKNRFGGHGVMEVF